MKEQEIQSDHDQEQATFDCKNATHDQEALTTRSWHISPPSREPRSRLTRKRAQNRIGTDRWAHHKFEAAHINVLPHEDYSDNKVDSSHFRTEAYHRQTRRRIEESSDIQAFDELIQRRIEKA